MTSRTFDVASYLRTRGSDSLEIQQIAATDFEEYRQINELILSGQRIESNVVIACADDTKEYDNIIPSKAANTILDMAGIEAVFVVTRNIKGYVSISARSHNKINVQRIMEEMGGGGHFNSAAAQVYDQTIAEVCEKLTDKIREEINGN